MTESGTATILFTDLVGSTALSDRLGDDQAEVVRRAYFGLIREAVATTGGKEVKTLGDGHMLVFASALDAVGCAVAIQQAVELHNAEPDAEQLGVRIGINAGDVTFDENDYFGTPVTIAKRLCDQASGGQIIVSDLVSALVGSRGQFSFADVGALTLRGLSQPLAAREVNWKGDELPSPAVIAAAAAASGAKKPKSRKGLLVSLLGVAAVVIAALAVVLATGGDKDNADLLGSGVTKPSGGAAGMQTVKANFPEAAAGSTVLFETTNTLADENSQRQHVLDLEKGESYTIDIVRAGGKSDFFAELLDPMGHVVAFNDDSGAGFEPEIKQYVAATTGRFTLVVTLNTPAVAGGYAVRVLHDKDTPNPSQGPFFGEIAEANQAQKYSFALQGGKPLTVKVVIDNRRLFSAELDLIDPSGKVVKSDQGSGQYGYPQIVDFLITKTGAWSILVRGQGPNELGAFQLSVDQGS